MRRPSWQAVVTLASFAAAPALAAAEPAEDDKSLDDVFSLMTGKISVTVATRTETTLSSSPSVVTVRTAEDIRLCACQSFADVLRTIPGFYDIYDLVSHNVGVRGVNGGNRAGGSIVKLMIDGMPVAFGTNTMNFFGPELIPLELIERIEIVRGPASAIYGSNAYLAAINIITKEATKLPYGTVVVEGGAIRDRPWTGGTAMAAFGWGNLEAVLGVSLARVDRSGLNTPSASPLLTASALRFAPDAASQNDLSHPVSMLGKLRLKNLGPGSLVLLASNIMLDAVGEFVDIEPMTHRTRVSLYQQTVRASYLIEGREHSSLESLRASLAMLHSGPGPNERFNLGNQREDLLRRVDMLGAEASIEAQARPSQDLLLLGAIDLRVERHSLQHYDRLLLTDVRDLHGEIIRHRGDVVPGSVDADGRVLHNVGFTVQGQYDLVPGLGLTAGMRLDQNSLYGLSWSPRLALVWAPGEDDYFLKAIFGRAFKAPSAEQLFTEPIRVFDIRGSPDLGPQYANTFELAAGYDLSGIGSIRLNGFYSIVEGRVAYVQRGLYYTAENTSTLEYVGAELEIRSQPVLGLRLQFDGGWVLKVRDRTQVDSVVEGVSVDQPLYPQLQAHLLVGYTLDVMFKPTLSAQASVIGPRQASEGNAALEGKSYEQPGYFRLDLSMVAAEALWGDRRTQLTVYAKNLLDQRYSDPGFGGIDFPALGLIVGATLTQEF